MISAKWIISAVVAVFGAGVLVGRCSREETVKERFVSDTVRLTKIDTIKVRELREVGYKVVDTLKLTELDTIYIDSIVYLPKEQKHYLTPQFEAWVSGVHPKLDSARVFAKTEYITIENITEKVVVDKSWQYWVGVGGGEWKDEIYPKVSLDVLSPTGVGGSIEVGYLQDAPIWSVSLKIKL